MANAEETPERINPVRIAVRILNPKRNIIMEITKAETKMLKRVSLKLNPTSLAKEDRVNIEGAVKQQEQQCKCSEQGSHALELSW